MQSERHNPLDLEKQRIGERLGELEKTVARAFNKLYGDPDANPPVPSMDARIKQLESVEKAREETKKTLVNGIIGSATIALGAIVLWIITVIRDAFIKH
jgi:hypothetical protein